MSQQTINIGTVANDGTGDPLRVAFDKTNDNFDEVYVVIPTTDQKAALAGTNGTPSSSNEYVTDSDSRLTNSRTPTGSAGGDLTGTYPNPTIANDTITNAKAANMAQNTIKGRVSLGSGDPEDLTAAQARAVIDVYSTSETPTTFTDLTDTFASYTGLSTRIIRVKADETGLEAVASGAGYTDENAQDAVGSILDNGTVGEVTFTYDDATPKISATIDNDAVTNAKLSNMAQNTIKGRVTASTGDPEDLSPFDARTVIDVYSKSEVDSIAVDTFLELTDAPDDYTGQANKIVSVKADETGLEFTDEFNAENAQDAVGGILDSGTAGDINFTYNDVTPLISGNVKNDAISNAKLANVATSTIKGRTTAGTGDPEDLTPSQARTVIDVYSKSEIDALTLLDLSDTPNSYTGHANKAVTVKADETGVEFTVASAGYTDENAQDAVGGILDNGTVGDITFTYTDATPLISAVVDNDSITNAKLANVATSTIKGRVTAGTGDPEDLSAPQARTVIDVYSKAEVDALAITDGNGTTANGTSVDLGGALTQNTTITGAFDITLGSSGSKIDKLEFNGTGDAWIFPDLSAQIVAGEEVLIQSSAAGDDATTIRSFNSSGGVLLRSLGTVKIQMDGASPVGAQYIADYSANYTSRSLPDVAYVLSKTTDIRDLSRVSVSVSSGTLTLDMASKQERKFENTTAISSNFTLALSNTTNAEIFNLIILITGTVVITMPSTVIMEKGDTRWNNGSKQLTLTGGTAEPFELSFNRMNGPLYICRSSFTNYAS